VDLSLANGDFDSAHNDEEEEEEKKKNGGE